ncbi:hypothetical protein DPMN_031114 [Dreissena polymorpha]|uniref:Uncharacterized protein n=2 Tax=Dreissena polymorpha TaxID=45954 RepID=A0A9D4M1Z3_DREPO|nr:hypothetical protein DPMN_031114 [Dreissena polymorpha]
MLADGDNTELGEKGTNISGGQKQRISVARAVYSNADVYILDDPLSAVDAHVGKDLFENVIGNSGMLKNKTRILVTHAVHWLPLVDNIIVMDGGKISEYGTYDQLMTRNGVFAQFLLQHLENEASQEDLDDPEIKWIRDNMLEQVEIVTSEGGNSEVSDSPSTSARLKKSRKKRLRRRQLSSMSVTQSQVMQDKTHVSMATNKQQGLVSDETIQEGSVKPKVTKDYLKAMGVFWVIISMATMLLYHVVSVYSMFWLTYWTEDPFLRNQSNVVEQEYSQASIFYLIIYAVMGLVQGVAIFVGYYLSLTKIIQASSVFHNRMLYSVLRSPMAFFDTVPVGRILNRFSSDVDMLDNRFPDIFRMWIYNALTTVAGVIVIIVCAPIFAAVIIPTIIIIGFMLHYYMPTARKLRRFEAVTRSPIFNHLSETLTGSTVIRSYRCNSRFVKEAANRIDTNSAFFFGANNGNRWISIRLQLFGNIIVLVVILLAVTSDILNGGQLGLAITYAVQVTWSMNEVVWSILEMEMSSVAAERINEYMDLPSEADWTGGKVAPPLNWPETGIIEYDKYATRYRSGLELVLKGISFKINHGEKIGVVGRTGAGKSSLALSLFRIIESAVGDISIDGVRIADLGLHPLRTRITILPQDPVLFSGTLRMNIDPLGTFSDEEIWRAIDYAHLKNFVTSQSEGLMYDCGEAGQNLSVGQRQLVCLARTLLNKTKILILDEATAAVDMETDALIQLTIRSQFADCTILTIAHRLNTVMDYDRVMVLDQGRIKEFDEPRELLKNKEGIFHTMAKDAGLI